MGPGATRDLVIQLRVARDGRGLSIHEVMDLLTEHSKKTGRPLPCESTVRSVLTGDLDKITGFSMDGTLRPMEEVLLQSSHEDDPVLQARISGLLDVIRIQEETIQSLTERLKAVEDAQRSRCKKCESDTAKLWGQIAIKDKRMERKDRWIAELLKLPPDSAEEDGGLDNDKQA